MVTVALPIVVQLVPLVLRDAVMMLPTRTRRTQMFGAVPELLLVLLTLPPVAAPRPQGGTMASLRLAGGLSGKKGDEL
jgi:hypothetical protein